LATRDALSSGAHHPYADLLMSSVPELRPGWLEGADSAFVLTQGREASVNGGCRFYSRCAVARLGLCDTASPPSRHADDRTITCHHDLDDLASGLIHAA